MMLTTNASRSLPLPTDKQWDAFTEHIVKVHSWYKHLRLLGVKFAVFLSPDAGAGYPSEYPKLPYGNTRDGFRRAFGYLDYMYQVHSRFAPTWTNAIESTDTTYCNDSELLPQLDDELMDASQFTVFPYVSPKIYWSIHSDSIARIRNGAPHPRASAIISAYDSDELRAQHWQSLSRDDADLVLSCDDLDLDVLDTLPSSVLRFLELDEAARQAYRNLHESEVSRVRSCVNQVRHWIQET